MSSEVAPPVSFWTCSSSCVLPTMLFSGMVPSLLKLLKPALRKLSKVPCALGTPRGPRELSAPAFDMGMWGTGGNTGERE